MSIHKDIVMTTTIVCAGNVVGVTASAIGVTVPVRDTLIAHLESFVTTECLISTFALPVVVSLESQIAGRLHHPSLRLRLTHVLTMTIGKEAQFVTTDSAVAKMEEYFHRPEAKPLE